MSVKTATSYFDDIYNIINQWDPLDLTKYDSNEYYDITENILNTIKISSAESTIMRCIYKSFYHTYGNHFTKSKSECLIIAKKIKDIIKGP